MTITKTTQIPARRWVQLVFLFSIGFIGVKFYLFVSYLDKGMMPGFDRPAGVEAFLPISALVSLKHWLYTGTINSIHPSALVLFLIICFTAVIVKKGFCSWICPIGLLSILIQNFWCRYLCPYGALLVLFSLLSLGKIHRHPSRCTGCGKCEKSCPEKDAIEFSLFNGRKSFTPGLIAFTFLLIFCTGITLAKMTGHWQNKISTREYLSYSSPKKRQPDLINQISPDKNNFNRLEGYYESH